MPEERIAPAAAHGFEQGAAAYEASRPSYPPAAVACISERARLGPGVRVLDLAAGTGKLTRLLVPTGAEVVAVEPVAAMRARLAELGGVEALDGTAEQIPLGDGSVDAVTVAQAFHWFDAPVALGEIARVLRPGGSLVLVWNLRDLRVDWVRRFGDLLVEQGEPRPYDAYHAVDYARVVADAGAGCFSALRRWSVHWEQPCSPELLVQRAASVSVVGALDPERREVVLDRIRRLTRSHPDLAGRPSFPFPYDTRVLWCTRR